MAKKRILMQLLSIFTVALLAFGGMVSGALAADKVIFFLDWVPYGKHSSFYAGIKYGIYKKYGLDVTIQPGKGSGLSIKTIGVKGAEYGRARRCCTTTWPAIGAWLKTRARRCATWPTHWRSTATSAISSPASPTSTRSATTRSSSTSPARWIEQRRKVEQPSCSLTT